MKHQGLIDQGMGAVPKLFARRRWLGFQSAVIGKISADRPDLNEPRLTALGKIGHGSETDLPGLLPAQGTDEGFGLVGEGFVAAFNRQIGAEQAFRLLLEIRIQIVAERERRNH